MASLESLVKERYSAAKANNDIFIFESSSTQKKDNGISFEINFVPTLAKKPIDEYNKTAKNDTINDNKQPINPFLNPSPALIVQENETHRILLNKFCVLPHHLLIITKDFQPQTLPLFPPDLMIGWKTLMTAYGPSSPGLLFYNCGPLSGASQPHKHMQLIPLIESGASPIQQAVNKIENSKAGEIYMLDSFPFVHVVTPLDRQFMDESPEAAVEDYLGQMFFGLLDAMFQQIRLVDNEKLSNVKPSYNFIMTSEFMLIVARRQEYATLTTKDERDLAISINSMGFAGYLLAKTEDEYEVLKTVNIMDVLSQVGIPRPLDSSSIADGHIGQQQTTLAN
ncbi:HIT-like domain-containing protein [Halteromyces radiatus]|uniref:HIT-like domain-containing protein n=1 Tax=Halteromyces radiatus TaxID=101107 RepID=UPI00221FC7C0|nr:HIT-like domain-containing protein [Halteromyces radiatus]KAI8083083.1 HIT-like domain-containing protein [Halteromyces radiatus]